MVPRSASQSRFSLSRAFFLGWLAALLAGLMSSCDPGDPEAIALARVEETPVATIQVLGRVDYFPRSIFDDFTAETGISVDYRSYANGDELEWILQHSPEEFDVLLTDDVSTRMLLGLGLCAPLDPELIPNLSNFSEEIRRQPWDLEGRYTVPVFQGSTLIAYNRDLLPDPRQSWSLLWDRERVDERPVLLVDEVCDLMGVASLSMGNSLDDVRRESLSGAVSKLELLSRVGPARFASYPVIREALVSDRCAMAVLYSNEARRASRENRKIAFFVPEEGAPQWMDSLSLMPNSPNLAVSHGFINFLLRADVGARWAHHNGGDTTNLAALEFAREEPNLERILPRPVDATGSVGQPFRVERPMSESLVTRMAGLMRRSYLSRVDR